MTCTPLTISLSMLVTVYEGPLDDNIVLYEFTTSAQTYLLDALLYKDYTVTARSVYNGKTVYYR
ncbi:MAG: hypothetical protein MZV63_13845 [Marinilabiliales bacterium]|nr:hypothetical protein [Marinilabiliales bacterium]